MGRKKLVRQKSQSIDHNLLQEFQTNFTIRLSAWKNHEILQEPEVPHVPNDLYDINHDQITFPVTLSSIYRRKIHLIAMELELFHCSIGSMESNNRQIIISRKLPIITPSEEDNGQSQLNPIKMNSLSFKSNICHQYFLLTPQERLHRQSLLGIGLDDQQREDLSQKLFDARSNNINNILPPPPLIFPLSSSAFDSTSSSPAPTSVVAAAPISLPAVVPHSPVSYIYQHENLSQAIGVDPHPTLPHSSFLHIQNSQQLKEVCCVVLSCPLNNEIAFDLEMNNNFVYHGCICLIQLSCKTTRRYVCERDLSLDQRHEEQDEDEDEDVSDLDSSLLSRLSPDPGERREWYDLDIVIDPMFIPWNEIAQELFPIFANPSIVKICHGARNGDVKALYRDFGIVIVNGFDTQEAWKYLGEEQLGLASVLMKLRAPGSGWNKSDGTGETIQRWGSADQLEEKEDYSEIKQRLSQADWTQRPLPDDMLRYGRMDVRFLIPLYHILVKRLWDRAVNNAASTVEEAAAAARRNLSFIDSMDSSMELLVDTGNKSQQLQQTLENSTSLHSIGTDLDLSPLPPVPTVVPHLPPASPRSLESSFTRFSFSFSEQPSLSPFPLSPIGVAGVGGGGPTSGIDQIFSQTLSNSRELWLPTIPNLNDKKATIKISSLKNKYEAFRRKAKSKNWMDLNTHIFMRLTQWRDRVAYLVNESPVYVCPTSLLLLISAKVPKTAEELHLMYNPLPVYLNLQPDHVTESGVKIENILIVIAESLEEYKQSNSRSLGNSVETILEMATAATASTPAPAPSASLPSQDTLQPQERQQRKIEEERGEEKDPSAEDTNRGEIVLVNVEVNTSLEHIEEVEDSLQTAAESREEIRKALPVSAVPTPLPFFVALVPQRSRWLRIAGALVAAGALSYFVGIGPPSFPLLGTLFPSFFSWTLRWRTNMNRL